LNIAAHYSTRALKAKIQAGGGEEASLTTIAQHRPALFAGADRGGALMMGITADVSLIWMMHDF